MENNRIDFFCLVNCLDLPIRGETVRPGKTLGPPRPGSRLLGVKTGDSGLENKHFLEPADEDGLETWGSDHPPDPGKASRSGLHARGT